MTIYLLKEKISEDFGEGVQSYSKNIVTSFNKQSLFTEIDKIIKERNYIVSYKTENSVVIVPKEYSGEYFIFKEFYIESLNVI